MKKTFLVSVFTLFCCSVWGQDPLLFKSWEQDSLFVLEHESLSFKDLLALPDNLNMGTVNIVEHGSAKEAVESFNSQQKPTQTIPGYRIRIFADKSQSARENATEAQNKFLEKYLEDVYLVYEMPYYFVTCGNYLTMQEAIMLLSKIRIHFPNAFPVRAEIDIKKL